jgi:hypothetical protein
MGRHLVGVHLMGYPVVVYLMGVDLSGRNCYPTPAYHCVGWHMVVFYGGPEWFRRGCEGRRKRRLKIMSGRNAGGESAETKFFEKVGEQF